MYGSTSLTFVPLTYSIGSLTSTLLSRLVLNLRGVGARKESDETRLSTRLRRGGVMLTGDALSCMMAGRSSAFHGVKVSQINTRNIGPYTLLSPEFADGPDLSSPGLIEPTFSASMEALMMAMLCG